MSKRLQNDETRYIIVTKRVKDGVSLAVNMA